MPSRVIVSLTMLGTICLGYVLMLFIQWASHERLPSRLWLSTHLALAAIIVFAGIDVGCYLMGCWPLPTVLQMAKSVTLWIILLVIIVTLVRFISSYRSASGRADQSEPGEQD